MKLALDEGLLWGLRRHGVGRIRARCVFAHLLLEIRRHGLDAWGDISSCNRASSTGVHGERRGCPFGIRTVPPSFPQSTVSLMRFIVIAQESGSKIEFAHTWAPIDV